MNLSDAKRIIKNQNHSFYYHAKCFLQGHAQGVAEERKRAENLVEAIDNFKKQWDAYGEKQNALLVKGQTLESASKNWEDFPECFNFNFIPLFKALSEYNQTQDKGGEK